MKFSLFILLNTLIINSVFSASVKFNKKFDGSTNVDVNPALEPNNATKNDQVEPQTVVESDTTSVNTHFSEFVGRFFRFPPRGFVHPEFRRFLFMQRFFQQERRTFRVKNILEQKPEQRKLLGRKRPSAKYPKFNDRIIDIIDDTEDVPNSDETIVEDK
ncbi:unnamed protein product [Brachionus calyciflorus]|uniref:Uncharacterized protein n=1 Tax=Brachionus calyciflorus TaxID=104777 RepID=A0A813W1U1_9BILA|nr:unnamed protein product [Brachionus calyciflorus]